MICEDHYGKPYEDKCPHCGSTDIEEIPPTNLLGKAHCKSCGFFFGYGIIDRKVRGVFKPESREMSEAFVELNYAC